MPRHSDRCAGASSFGHCEIDRLVICDQGRPGRVDCAAIGQECGLDGETGQYGCVDPVWAQCDERLRLAVSGAPCKGSWDCHFNDGSDEIHVWCDHGQIQMERARRRKDPPPDAGQLRLHD